MDFRTFKYGYLWWLRRDGVRVRLRQVEGANYINAADGRLRLASPKRVGLYKRGIQARLNRLAETYCIPNTISLGEGDLVLDIGANIGEFSLWAADRGASVVAFEPDPTTLECLRENAAGKRIEIEPFGLWYEATTMRFFTAPDEADGSLINDSGQSIEMNVLPLDDIMRRRGFPHVRLIKLDAEGAEPEVLRGASETLQRTSYISIDTGEERNGNSSTEDCKAILTTAGFRIVHESGKRNVIVASRS